MGYIVQKIQLLFIMLCFLESLLPWNFCMMEKKDFHKMTDFTDEINIAAAGYATKLGEAKILR